MTTSKFALQSRIHWDHQEPDADRAARHTERPLGRPHESAPRAPAVADDWTGPLGFSFPQRPEIGPPAARYFEHKHARGEFGTYWPLHLTATFEPKERGDSWH
jgi:hypothetical protein